jgi:CTP:molybdopterin cytidylyltransferase MocA
MGDYKPMMKLGGVSFSQRVVDSFREADVSPIVVVTGYRAEALEAHLARRGLVFLRNEDYKVTQMFDSALIGLRYIQDKCDRTFFCPVDVPLFTAETVRRLMCVSGDSAREKIVKPMHDGVEGHPILIGCERVRDILGARFGSDNAVARKSDAAAGGLKSALAPHEEDTMYVDVDDAGILYDADTPDDYRALASRVPRQTQSD